MPSNRGQTKIPPNPAFCCSGVAGKQQQQQAKRKATDMVAAIGWMAVIVYDGNTVDVAYVRKATAY